MATSHPHSPPLLPAPAYHSRLRSWMPLIYLHAIARDQYMKGDVGTRHEIGEYDGVIQSMLEGGYVSHTLENTLACTCVDLSLQTHPLGHQNRVCLPLIGV
jgi:hypothetical protein